MTYKGDTPPKKVARLQTWLLARTALGVTRFHREPHLVLAGPEAGDVSVALGLGAPPEHLYAVDWNKKAAMSAQGRFPGVHIQHGDVLDVLQEECSRFGIVFLDFCSQITDEVVRAASAGATALLRGGLLACTFLVGREQAGQERNVIMREKRDLDRKVRGTARQEVLPYLARSAAFQRLLEAQSPTMRFAPLALIFYKSCSQRKIKGMPMCIYLTRPTHIIEEHRPSRPKYFFFTTTARELGAYAVELDQQHNAALLLNVSRGTVAAWKAHASRHTPGYPQQTKETT